MSENKNNETTADVKDSAPVVEPTKTEVKPEPTKVEAVAEKIEAIVEEPKIEEAPAEKSDVIEVPKSAEKPGIGSVGNGAMGVTTFKEEKEDSVAIYSSRNVTWQGVGKVYTGYNLVTKAAADQWLTRNHTRVATPEEVAKEYGL
jgi:hypothetical protein